MQARFWVIRRLSGTRFCRSSPNGQATWRELIPRCKTNCLSTKCHMIHDMLSSNVLTATICGANTPANEKGPPVTPEGPFASLTKSY